MKSEDLQLIQDLDPDSDPENYYQVLQRLINDGGAWQLEGFYGRSMMAAINKGFCLLGKISFNDYYGNKVPARDEVKEGTKGSRQFVVANQGEKWANLMENIDI